MFSKSYDFVRWLLPLTLSFPRQQRFVLAERLQASALDFMECLYRAVDASQRVTALREADARLRNLRFYLRLSHDLQLLDTRRYEHASRALAEVGSLLGAWLGKVGAAIANPPRQPMTETLSKTEAAV